LGDLSTLPVSLKILLENLLRAGDGRTVSGQSMHVKSPDRLAQGSRNPQGPPRSGYRPARVLMQDSAGVPAVVDIWRPCAAAMTKLGGDPNKINPLAQVDLVIDPFVGRGRPFRRVPKSLKENVAPLNCPQWRALCVLALRSGSL